MKWYARDPKKALRGKEGLTLEERGAYDTLLDLIYERGEAYPDDERKLAGLMGVSVRKWKLIRQSLLDKDRVIARDTRRGPVLADEQADIELENQAARSRINSESGAKGGGKSAEKRAASKENSGLGEAPAQAEGQASLKLKTETETETPPPPLAGGQADLLGDAPEKPRRRKPKRPIPDDFPSEADIAEQQALARAAGADVDMAYQAERFRNWALGADHRYADWQKTWANWCLRTVREAPKRAGTATAAPTDPVAVWRQRVERYLNGSRYWNTNDWEAPPGKPGCIVPVQILAEFNIVPPLVAAAEERAA